MKADDVFLHGRNFVQCSHAPSKTTFYSLPLLLAPSSTCEFWSLSREWLKRVPHNKLQLWITVKFLLSIFPAAGAENTILSPLINWSYIQGPLSLAIPWWFSFTFRGVKIIFKLAQVDRKRDYKELLWRWHESAERAPSTSHLTSQSREVNPSLHFCGDLNGSLVFLPPLCSFVWDVLEKEGNSSGSNMRNPKLYIISLGKIPPLHEINYIPKT